jgi:hypothetical protein
LLVSLKSPPASRAFEVTAWKLADVTALPEQPMLSVVEAPSMMLLLEK